jgi:hypothetical protein
MEAVTGLRTGVRGATEWPDWADDGRIKRGLRRLNDTPRLALRRRYCAGWECQNANLSIEDAR